MEELTTKVENGEENVTEGATAALPDFAVKMDMVGFSYADG